MKSFPSYQQLDAMDCGPTCLRMVARYYGKSYSLQYLRDKSFITKLGVSMLGIKQAAQSIGFDAMGVKITFQQLVEDAPLPCILHWNNNHFVVCYDIRKNKNNEYTFRIADPASGLQNLDETLLRSCWTGGTAEENLPGAVMLLQPGDNFKNLNDETLIKSKYIQFLTHYLSPYKKQLRQILIGMFVLSILQLLFPFLTQALVDSGIRNSDMDFIKLVLLAQAIIFIARLSIEYLRSWIVLHMNTRINISLISDFLIKLTRMPLRFFDSKNIGDIMQRIGDHSRIETFLTGNAIGTLFSLFNFVIFSIVLLYYNPLILLVFLLGNTIYILWVVYFMKYRKALDYKRFTQASKEQSNLLQLISGMQDVKLNNCENQKRWKWERIQIQLFQINIKSLSIGQFQQVGSIFFNQSTSLIITFMAAQAVVNGSMSLGMMLAITYIIGQLNGPVEQFIGFAQALQEAKLSLERLNEIHQKKDEEDASLNKYTELPHSGTLKMENVSFSYDGSGFSNVLNNINLIIPDNQVTAIVGASGSGKTTLIKLLLGFYEPSEGRILLGDTVLNTINPHTWRSNTGAVLQDGFLFSESIACNIALGEDTPNPERVRSAAKIACIDDFIVSLPMKYDTVIGVEGMGLSQGQKQRILIARAVYKNPHYLFFDEATNALDANNEQAIMKGLEELYKGKTVVVVAHRLSTVRKADQIIVLENGQIVETGTHEMLTAAKGLYFNLVKNQLELGN